MSDKKRGSLLPSKGNDKRSNSGLLAKYRKPKSSMKPTQTNSIDGNQQPKSPLRKRYAGPGNSNVFVAMDFTGSMDAQRQQVVSILDETIIQAQQFAGSVAIRLAAYRDYSDGNGLFESTGWHQEAAPLQKFLSNAECYGGADFPEAVEYALRQATKDEHTTRIILIGDAPPHQERDYRHQAKTLAQMQRPVYSFVVGQHPDTWSTFREISKITGGACAPLKSAEELLQLITITVADDLEGESGVQKYLQKVQQTKKLTASAQEYGLTLIKNNGK